MNGFSILIGSIVAGILSMVVFELYLARKRNIQIYTFSDSVVNISCGILERTFDFFYSVLFLLVSTYVYENLAPFKIPPSALTFIVAILLFDLLAYWYHRLSHEINFLWAAHIVHHQSEELNITTVFRVSFFAVIYRSIFFISMPFIGFDPFTILVCGLILAIYQLFTHSRLIGKLGVFEIFMTTPSHHRVHHGINEKYMDHNYGHIFIFWDKLFGTFVEETEEPVYGITSGFVSTNPYTAQFSYWQNLILRARKMSRFADKFKVFVKGPAWTSEDVAHLAPVYKTDTTGKRIHFKVKVKKELGFYILLNTFFTFALFIGLIKGLGNKNETFQSLIQDPKVMVLVCLILFSIFVHGKMFEQSIFAYVLDLMRLFLVGFGILFWFDLGTSNPVLLYSVLSFCAIMLIWFTKLFVQSVKNQETVLSV